MSNATAAARHARGGPARAPDAFARSGREIASATPALIAAAWGGR